MEEKWVNLHNISILLVDTAALASAIAATHPQTSSGLSPDEALPIVDLLVESEERDMIVNVNREYPSEAATVILGYILPFVLILTLITNTLVVMVLAKKHMRTPTNIVLFTMAVVDLLTLVFPSPWYFYIYTLGYPDKFLYPPNVCYIHHIMTDVIPIFFHTSSIWLALLLASQRYIYVCHPTLANTWCTVKRVQKAIITILIVAFLHQSSKFLDENYKAVRVSEGGTLHYACKRETADWVGTYFTLHWFYITYYIFRILFVFLIPCVALITLNCLLFAALRRAEDKRTRLLGARFKSSGANRSSAGGGIVLQQYNSIQDNRYSSTIEVVSAMQPVARDSLSSAARIPSPIIEGTREDVALLYRRDSMADQRGEGQVKSEKNSDEPTSESKLSYNTLDDRVPMAILLGRRPQFESQRSQESNKSCPVTSILSRSETGSSSDKITSRFRSDHGSSGCTLRACGNNGGEGEEDGKHSSGREDELTCASCCEYHEDDECMRLLREGATGAGKTQLCQAFSQCSSTTGGATNTTQTTIEDNSSSAAINNTSCSLIGNGGSPPTEVHLERGGDRFETSCAAPGGAIMWRDYKSMRGDFPSSAEGNRHQRVRKSGSVDSRLACGCAPSGSRSLHLSLTGAARRSRCPDCFSGARQVRHSMTRAGSGIAKQQKQTRRDACSCSEPCINCHNNSQQDGEDRGAETAEGAQVLTQARPLLTSHSNSSNGIHSGRARVPVAAAVTAALATHKVCTTATTNTTTTTTLQSTTANSECSLVQIQTQQCSRPPARADGAGIPQHLGGNAAQRKSHSVIGSSFRARGNSSQAFQTGVSTNASMRSIDSNRTTLMLIVVVSVFLIVEVPVAVTTIIHVCVNTFAGLTDVSAWDQKMNYIKLFTNFFIMLSYSVNFTIYCSMSKKFRETFKDLFAFGKRARDQQLRQVLTEHEQQQYQQAHQSQYSKHTFKQQSEPPAPTSIISGSLAPPVSAGGTAAAAAAAATVAQAAALGPGAQVPPASDYLAKGKARDRKLRYGKNQATNGRVSAQRHDRAPQQECEL